MPIASQARSLLSEYTLEEVLGKDHNIVNSGYHSKDFWKEMYDTVVKKKGIWHNVVTNKGKNGDLYYVDTYIKASFDDGHLTGFTSIRQDVTELKKKEMEIRAHRWFKSKYLSITDYSFKNTL